MRVPLVLLAFPERTDRHRDGPINRPVRRWRTAIDFVSHGLWGGIAFGRRSRKAFLAAIGISLLPDLLGEGALGLLTLLDVAGMPGWEHGHPNLTDYPPWAQTFYNVTHSLVVFAVVFGAVWLLARKPVWIMGAWGLHILIDIPTHAIDLFPTPFLWPLSDYKFDGVAWHHPLVFAANAGLLAAAYGGYWLWRRRKGVAARRGDRP